MLRKFCVAVIIILLALKTSYAFESGTLRGRVIDGFGKPISFANIEAMSDGSKSKTTSDSTGIFSVNYNPGNIKLTFHKEGYPGIYTIIP